MLNTSRIRSHDRSGLRRVLRSGAVKLSTVLLMAFALGAVAGVSPGGGQGNFASALLSGGLIKSAHALDKPAATPGARLLAKTGDAERIAPQWRVMSVRGTAEVRDGSRMWHRWNSAKPGHLLNSRAQVRTGPDAQVIVSNGHDTLTLAPDSTLELPAPGAKPGLTQVIQTRGTINYDIESRILPGTKEDRPSLKKVLFSTQRIRGRFEIVTPLLLVGVKGTKFDVNVGSGGTSVDVSEGVVDVETPDGEDAATVVAGQTASVSTHGGNAVSVTTSTTASATPAVSPVGPTAAATSDGDDDDGVSAAASSGGGGGSGSGDDGGNSGSGKGGNGGGNSGSGGGGGNASAAQADKDAKSADKDADKDAKSDAKSADKEAKSDAK